MIYGHRLTKASLYDYPPIALILFSRHHLFNRSSVISMERINQVNESSS
jgi:hypothetical protein